MDRDFESWDSFVAQVTRFSGPDHHDDGDEASFHPQSSIAQNNELDRERFWITQPFAPLHRCRELIFWAVNWKGYEDAESAAGSEEDGIVNGRSWSGDWVKTRGIHPYKGHPERTIAWTQEDRKNRIIDLTRSLRTGSQVYHYCWNWTRSGIGPNETVNMFSARWGADRDGDRKFTIGPVSKTTRMFAQPVVRLNFYDPTLKLHAGN